MISQLNVIKKIISLIVIIFFTGCAESIPLVFQKPSVQLKKSENQWSADFGPEQSGHFKSIAVDDFNNDGNFDIVGGGSEPDTVFLWYGDGLGNWERKQRFPIKADIHFLVAGDIDNDGWIDLLSSSIGDSEGIQLWKNKNGLFEPGRPVTERDIYGGLRLADINDDGNLDVIAANNTSVKNGGIRVWLGNGKGDFFNETGPTRKGLYRDVAVGDFNNDNKLDLVGAGWFLEAGALRVWLGIGDGRWAGVKSSLEEGSFWGVDTADINNDGNLDIVVATSFAGVKIYYGDGKGGFPEKDVLTSKGSFRAVRAVDIDKNGLIDIVAASNNNNGILIWYQEKQQKRTAKDEGLPVEGFYEDEDLPEKWTAKDEGLPVEGFYFDFVAVDLNKDGNIDIASTSQGEGINIWFRGAFAPTIAKKIKKTGEKNAAKKEDLSEKGKEVIEKEIIVIPETVTYVFFDSVSAALNPKSIVVLSRMAEFLKKHESITIKLEGHAVERKIDGSKKLSDSQAFALARTKTVTDFLVSSGINKERIEVSAYTVAEMEPGDDPRSFQKQNRVDIITNKVEVVTIQKKVAGTETNGRTLDEKALKKRTELVDPFRESGDIVPITEFKAFKVINNIPEYRIGPGDILDVTVWEGVKEKLFKVVVTTKGTVTFSFFTNFPIKGLTPTEAEREFSELLKEVILVPKIKVIVSKKLAHAISIFGDVNLPGTFTLSGQERLTQFLSRAKVNLRAADLTRVQLTRNRRTYFLNINDALFKGDFRQDIFIDSGDVIFVPKKRRILNKVFVMGEVAKPGMFISETNLTLLEAIVQAGGPTFYGKTSDVIVIRGEAAKPEGIKINFDDIVKKGDFTKNIRLQNGDIVYIAKNTVGNIHNFITKISPFIDLARLPLDVYGATALPYWEGFPLYREAAPSGTTVIQSSSSPPDGAGTWQIQQLK